MRPGSAGYDGRRLAGKRGTAGRKPGRHAPSLRLTALGLAAATLVGGCLGAGGTGGGGAGAPSLPTPQASLSAQLQGTVAVLANALLTAGFRLDPPVVPYRPGEPADLAEAPRAVFQISIPDANQGYVVIYDLSDPGTATSRGQQLAAYLGGGFGQTNFPVDAQFSIGQVGSTLIFTWWSRSLASDKTAAETAFNAVRGVGQPIPVTK
jgi:hypothetical protein